MKSWQRTTLAGVGALALSCPLGLGGVAQADTATAAAPTSTLASWTAGQLASVTQLATQVQGLSLQRVNRYLAEAVAGGRLIDIRSLRVATIKDTEAGQIDAIWDDGSTMDYLGVENTVGATASDVETGVATVFNGPEGKAGSSSAAGSGYTAGVNPAGMYQYGNNGCRTVYFDAEYSSTDSQLVTCWQKWAQSGTNRWIYNRWALFSRANPPSGTRAETQDFTTRSKPWKDQEYKTPYMDNWSPAVGSDSCTATQTFKLTAGPVSLDVPLHRCSTTQVLPDTGKRHMGMMYTGHATSQVFNDFGMAIRANTTSAIPVMADYSYAKIMRCGNLGIDCHGTASEAELLADSGWVPQ